ncbi:hypothetical protein [Kutzneria sp. NPDC051319]|uniref:hypothetical protein n=1 Tax=Kutzneria sp. NPDC051319 TaxID=3155047 RepID=UPI00343D2AA4
MITSDSFPTPDLAQRSADPVELARVREFAGHQAAEAEALRQRLAEQLPAADPDRRVLMLRRALAELIQWRYQLALTAPGRLGIGIKLDAERFRTPLRSDPNFDRLGTLGRLRAGAEWDPASLTYRGGTATPASRIMDRYGRAALARFDAEAPGEDVLRNEVLLPDGRRVMGNRLVRGEPAAELARQLVIRVGGRGHDASRMEIGGELLFAVTAADDDADTLHAEALRRLANALDEDDHRARVWEWQTARYLLYQSPRTKKGSDAVIRVLLVVVGAVLFERPPVMQQDADLRCAVLGQLDATRMPADAALDPR